MLIVVHMYIYKKKLKKNCDVLPSGGLFLLLELIPLFPYLRASLSQKGGGGGGGGGGRSQFGPTNRSLITDYSLKGFLTSRLYPGLKKNLLVLFMSSLKSLVTYPPTKR